MSKYFDLTDIKKIKPNPDNPRVIKDEAYQKLVKSIQDFPQMLELRPIVIDEAGVILGGNMRYRACIDAGMKKVPTVQANTLTDEQKREFIIKDNVGFGDWDWGALGSDWDKNDLRDWNVDVPDDEVEVDYSILDNADAAEKMNLMHSATVRVIPIEFKPEDYEEAYQVIKQNRANNVYIGMVLVKALKDERHCAPL